MQCTESDTIIPNSEFYLSMFYSIIRAIATFFFHIIFHIKVCGREHIVSAGQILFCNHQSYIDPVFLINAFPRKCGKIHFMAKASLWKNPVLRLAFPLMNVFPVKRGEGDQDALVKAGEYAKTATLGIFPEGTRSKKGGLLRFKSGTALIATTTGAPLLPCCIYYEKGLAFRRKITIRFGESMNPADYENIRDLTRAMRASIEELLAQKHNAD